MYLKNQQGFLQTFLIALAGLGILLFILFSSSFPFKDKLFSQLYPKPSSHAALGQASFELITAQSTYEVGDLIPVQIIAHSDLEAANLFKAKIKYDINLLVFESAATSSAFISNWAETYGDNTLGEVSLVGGVPNPGFQSQVTDTPLMATVYFRVLNEGTVNLIFDPQTAIYRNSDNTKLSITTKGKGIGLAKKQSPSPTPSASPSPSPSPTSTPAPTPTPSPTSTPTPSPSTPTFIPGDGNGDGVVDLADLSVLFSDFNKTSGFRVAIDLNSDGIINAFDFSLMRLLLIENGIIRG